MGACLVKGAESIAIGKLENPSHHRVSAARIRKAPSTWRRGTQHQSSVATDHLLSIIIGYILVSYSYSRPDPAWIRPWRPRHLRPVS